MNKKILSVLIGIIFVIPFAISLSFPLTESTGVYPTNTQSSANWQGFNFSTNTSNMTITKVGTFNNTNPTKVVIVNSSLVVICKFNPNTDTNCTLPYVGRYYVLSGSDGSAYTNDFSNSATYPYNGQTVVFTSSCGDNALGAPSVGTSVSATISCGETTRVRNIDNITFNQNGTQAKPNISISIINAVNNSNIAGFSFNYSTSNGSDTNTKNGYCASTSCFVTNFSGTINIDITNITGYFNTSTYGWQLNITSVTAIANTTQALLNVTAYQRYTNISINGFNVTNNFAKNNTPSSFWDIIPANTGQNNISIVVAGNVSMPNTTCNAISLSISNCNMSGFYDNSFTIGANYTGSSVQNFSITVINQSNNVNFSLSTTNGSIVFPLLQGYYYGFFINASGYALTNVTLQANATTNTYNFSLYQQNTFELHFYNETTNTQLNNVTVTINVIGSFFSQNYSTSNGSIIIPLLTPDSYDIRYYYDPAVPRDYYATITNQSYNNLTLYTIDAIVSNTYIPIVVDQNTAPISGALVQSLRAYIVNNQYTYYPVEMTKTDTNGQGVMRVVPNTIYYKLIISNSGFSTTTAPTKFTSSTNTYTLSQQTSPLTSIVGMPSVTKSFTYNNATQTYTFTWSDTNNLVTGGCMTVTESKGQNSYTPYNTCSTGSTGSLTYTVADTNNTRYSASAVLSTNTQYSNYNFGPVSVDYTTTVQTFGRIGMLLLLIVLLAVGFVLNESGSDGMIIGSMVVMVFFGVIGIIAYSWEAFIPVIIFGGVLIYKTRGR